MPNNHLNGLAIVPCIWAATRPWVFPDEPFVEYEPKDEAWCRKLGIGHEGPYKPSCLRIGDTLYCHPTIIEAIERQIGKRVEQSVLETCSFGSLFTESH
jgi:hypothetical protein